MVERRSSSPDSDVVGLLTDFRDEFREDRREMREWREAHARDDQEMFRSIQGTLGDHNGRIAAVETSVKRDEQDRLLGANGSGRFHIPPSSPTPSGTSSRPSGRWYNREPLKSILTHSAAVLVAVSTGWLVHECTGKQVIIETAKKAPDAVEELPSVTTATATATATASSPPALSAAPPSTHH